MMLILLKKKKKEKEGPIQSKIDDKAGYALGRGYLVIDKALPQWVLGF